MDGVEDRLQLGVTEGEREFGFAEVEEPSGVRAVVCELRPGLRAVKVRAPDGSSEYAICEDHLRPLYQPAKTVDELRQRFPRRT